jgi:hypothetical protein
MRDQHMRPIADAAINGALFLVLSGATPTGDAQSAKTAGLGVPSSVPKVLVDLGRSRSEGQRDLAKSSRRPAD